VFLVCAPHAAPAPLRAGARRAPAPERCRRRHARRSTRPRSASPVNAGLARAWAAEV